MTQLRRRVSMVFQQPNPFPMSIFDNVAYALREQGSRRPVARGAAPGGDGRARARRAVRRGARQPRRTRRCACRVASSSGCASRARWRRGPEVLLLDEPCSALDPRSTATIEELIMRLREEVAVVIVTHNLQQALRVADHVGVHVPGRAGRVRAGGAGVRRAARAAHEGVRRAERLGEAAAWPCSRWRRRARCCSPPASRRRTRARGSSRRAGARCAGEGRRRDAAEPAT